MEARVKEADNMLACLHPTRNHATFQPVSGGKQYLHTALLAGAKILLNNAVLNLKRGKRYGLCGPNGCGKSTLMRSIANGQVKEFPPQDELKTVYVEHDIDAEETEQPVINFICSDKELKSKSYLLLRLGANPSPIFQEFVSMKMQLPSSTLTL